MMLDSYKRNLSVGFSTQDHFAGKISQEEGPQSMIHTQRSGSFAFAELLGFMAK
jgi:hypothetical protein